LVPAVLAIFTAKDAFGFHSRPNDLVSILGDPILWLTGLVFFLYGPLEGSLGTWATTYLTDLGFRERIAAWLLSGFWLAFLAARLVAALLQEKMLPGAWEAWLICGLALAAGVFLGNMAGARRRGTAALGLLAVGAFFGPIFPTLVGILFNHFHTGRGTAFGAMFSIGAVGSLILPPVIGAHARRATVQRAMRIPLVIALVLAIVSMALALYPLLKSG
jgi:MFS family permease